MLKHVAHTVSSGEANFTLPSLHEIQVVFERSWDRRKIIVDYDVTTYDVRTTVMSDSWSKQTAE
jgi:hypothetical protein